MELLYPLYDTYGRTRVIALLVLIRAPVMLPSIISCYFYLDPRGHPDGNWLLGDDSESYYLSLDETLSISFLVLFFAWFRFQCDWPWSSPASKSRHEIVREERNQPVQTKPKIFLRAPSPTAITSFLFQGFSCHLSIIEADKKVMKMPSPSAIVLCLLRYFIPFLQRLTFVISQAFESLISLIYDQGIDTVNENLLYSFCRKCHIVKHWQKTWNREWVLQLSFKWDPRVASTCFSSGRLDHFYFHGESWRVRYWWRLVVCCHYHFARWTSNLSLRVRQNR